MICCLGTPAGAVLFSSLLFSRADLAERRSIVQDTPTSLDDGWNMKFSSSAPHYFASAYRLFQQRPNSFFPNGHSIVPCEISQLTRSSYGRLGAEAPSSPAWLAFDV
ncbi:MAG: hypothetical protein Q9203_002208 [Teloschistes exilis]